MHCSDPSVVCDWPDVGDGDSGGDYDVWTMMLLFLGGEEGCAKLSTVSWQLDRKHKIQNNVNGW
jgi:hypothetical protein